MDLLPLEYESVRFTGVQRLSNSQGHIKALEYEHSTSKIPGTIGIVYSSI